MKFNTPCFVRVENAEERKKLAAWLEKIGYYVCACVLFDNWHTLSCCNIDRNGELVGEVHGIPDHDSETGFGIEIFKAENTQKEHPEVDCGTDVELFKAIAAMTNENDRDQWFIDERGVWFWCRYYSISEFIDRAAIRGYDIGGDWFRKATVEEIIVHLKHKPQ